MDKETRNAIERATQKARWLLEEDLTAQLEGTYAILRSGVVEKGGGAHLDPRQSSVRDRIAASVAHRQAAGEKRAEAVASYIRDAAFTALNRFVALKMLEARGLVQECLGSGEQSSGYREFHGLAPGLPLLPDGAGYRLYLESLFDELSTEVKVLFDRRDPASALWPRRAAFEELLGVLNSPELAVVWGEDETIGWVYQYFNSGDERRAMRDASQAPRNSRELAVRNQFFTPRYVVRFLTENTLARIWITMMGGADGDSRIADHCDFLVNDAENRVPRAKKDPRDLKLLDPACGSGHFLLFSFDLLLVIYEEAWEDPGAAFYSGTGRTLRQDYPDLDALRKAAPLLVLEHNLHGVDIDPRCAQIAALALWLRAQRAWKEAGVLASERPLISRTNIVVAEPMPGDEALVEEFAATLNPPLLGTLFRKMVAEMRLAGELGTLLKVETLFADEIRKANADYNRQKKAMGYLPGFEPPPTQGELDFSQIDDDTFFDRAEELLLSALRVFAESAAGGAGVRKRLFAGDAAQGIAFVDIVRAKFDVVLMNPPFGEPTNETRPLLKELFAVGRPDLYLCFALRMPGLLGPGGLVGAITSRTFQTLEFFIPLRQKLLGSSHGLILLADLGGSVLDGATVETSAWIASVHGAAGRAAFIQLDDVGHDEREQELRAVAGGEQQAVTDRVFWRSREALLSMPAGAFAYSLPDELAELFRSRPALDSATAAAPLAGTRPESRGHQAFVRQGLIPGDLFRFTRARWEVPDAGPGRARTWVPFVKGGDYSRYYSREPLVLKWQANGREMKAFAEQRYGSASRTIKNERDFFRCGVSYPRVSSVGMNARWMEADSVFSDTGMAVLPEEKGDTLVLLGFLNSQLADVLCAALHPGRKFEVAHVAALPNALTALERCGVGEVASKLLREVRLLSDSDIGNPSANITERYAAAGNLRELIDDLRLRFVRGWSTVASLQASLNEKVAAAFQLSRVTVDYCGERFLARTSAREVDPTVLATLAPELLTEDKLLARAPDDRAIVERWLLDVLVAATEGASRCWSPDDPGHPWDVTESVRQHALFQACGRTEDVEAILEVESLRSWIKDRAFRKASECYVVAGRVASLVWCLGTATGRYGVWGHSKRVKADSLFELLHDVVAPKLALEERKLLSLAQEFGPDPSASQRKEVALLEGFADELKAFRDEVARVAPLWKPNLDDGVLLTMAPLWRLVPQHRAWQKELKEAWDSLCKGEFDWAHVAMNLWPERVVPKCAKDRSLAIAHGLEAVFWEEDARGKWAARREPLQSIAELVAERTSPAVKDALKDLLEAPAASGAARPGGRGKRRSS